MKNVCKAICIFVLIIIITLIFIFIAGWISSIAYCEYLTSQYGYQFEDLYKENTMLGNLFHLKVLTYHDDYAEVYYVTGNKESGAKCGDVLSFRKENGNWIYDKWLKTVWSNHGSADGYIWPYGR